MPSLYIRPTSKGWSLMRQTYVSGKTHQKTVRKTEYSRLGIHSCMSADEVRARVRQINADNFKQRIELARQRAVEIKIRDEVFLPDQMTDAFERWMEETQFGNAYHQKKLISHWRTVQKLILKLEIHPKNYADNKERIYKALIKSEVSFDYARKLLRSMNEWGKFNCRSRGEFFEPIPTPRALVREKINDAYFDSAKFRGESDPLTPHVLAKMESQMRDLAGQYEWLFVSVWLGLRPSEIDATQKQPNSFILEFNESLNVDVLKVYQRKLVGVEKSKRWKSIPIFLTEQKAAVIFLANKKCRRPLPKTIQKHSGNERLGLYGGRKGFTDLMLSKGQSLEDISQWMGHQSIEMTWAKYKSRKHVSFTKS